MRHINDLSFRLITPEDATDLLTFETTERMWFQQSIEARSKYFYTPEGVAQHIVECLALNAQRRMDPLIIRDKGVLVGRANLRDITESQATIGYRIAQHACGQGLAQKAVQHLIKEARSVYGITQLRAIVSEENKASRRVLEKADFKMSDWWPAHSLVRGSYQDCWLYTLHSKTG